MACYLWPNSIEWSSNGNTNNNIIMSNKNSNVSKNKITIKERNEWQTRWIYAYDQPGSELICLHINIVLAIICVKRSVFEQKIGSMNNNLSWKFLAGEMMSQSRTTTAVSKGEAFHLLCWKDVFVCFLSVFKHILARP